MINILLIDLSSIAHPLFHVSASDPDPNATSTKTVERVRALASGQPHVAICCDSGRSFRKDISADYKGNRPEHDAALQHQITLAMETLIADGFPVWFNKGFEADDLIATATHLASGGYSPQIDASVVIASSDKDLLQLVNPNVKVKSLTNGNEYDEDAVLLKFGVRPDQMRDWLSLVGDASDNIQGAKGIGAKGATKLLTKYGNLEDLYTDLDKHGTNFTPALATSLREFQPRMATVRELITLRTDVPLPFDEIFRERVPQDVAIFGDEPVNDEAGRAADIAEAMSTLHETRSPDGDGRDKSDALKNGWQPAQGNLGPEQAVDQVTTPLHDPRKSVPIAAGWAGSIPVATQQAGSEPAVSHSSMLALRSYETQLEPQTYAEAKALAADLFAARLFNGYGSAPAVLSTIIIGRELGLSAGASLRGFHIIDGKHAMAADLIRARVLASPVCEYFRCTERTAEKATFVTKRKGDPEIGITFTIAEGRAAFSGDDKAFAKSGYGRNPADQLVARCSSKLCRLVYPDVVHGFYAPEEFE